MLQLTPILMGMGKFNSRILCRHNGRSADSLGEQDSLAGERGIFAAQHACELNAPDDVDAVEMSASKAASVGLDWEEIHSRAHRIGSPTAEAGAVSRDGIAAARLDGKLC